MSDQKTILVIDDDPDFQFVQRTLLEAEGYEVMSALCGAEGLEQIQQKKPDLILLDVMMTEKTEGFNFASDLRRDRATEDIPIVLVTAINQMEKPIVYSKTSSWPPVDVFLEKPVKPAELFRVIRELLAGRHPYPEKKAK